MLAREYLYANTTVREKDVDGAAIPITDDFNVGVNITNEMPSLLPEEISDWSELEKDDTIGAASISVKKIPPVGVDSNSST